MFSRHELGLLVLFRRKTKLWKDPCCCYDNFLRLVRLAKTLVGEVRSSARSRLLIRDLVFILSITSRVKQSWELALGVDVFCTRKRIGRAVRLVWW